MAEFKLPDVGEGLTEAEIVTWKVKVGDTVAINDIVVEIETAKSLVELPSPYAGVVPTLLVPEGETVPVGTPIIAIGDADGRRPRRRRRRRRPRRDRRDRPVQPGRQRRRRGRVAWSAATRPTAAPYAGARARLAVRRRRGGAAAQQQLQGSFEPGDRRRRSWSTSPTSRPCPPTAGRRPSARAPARALAKPPVRKLAKDLGVDLADARPAPGPNGTVTRDDVAGAPPAASTLGTTRRRAATASARRRRASARPASRSRASAR